MVALVPSDSMLSQPLVRDEATCFAVGHVAGSWHWFGGRLEVTRLHCFEVLEPSLVIDDGGELALFGQFGFASAVKDLVCGGQ